jgi:hypothetical protein
MSDQFEGMSDAELSEVIMSSEESDVGETSESISPAEESNEQFQEEEVATDVDQVTEDEETSEEDSTVDDQTDDSEEETSTNADEADEDDTDLDEDKGTNTDDNNQTQTKYQPLKANGKEYPIDDIGELYKLASAGVGAQQKYQAIAGHKKSIMAADKAGVNLDDAINMMANYTEDPKAAIMKLLQDNNIDPMDIDLEGFEGKTKDHSVSDFEVSYDEVVGEIGNSPIFPKVQELLLNGWDKSSRDVFLEKPEMIRNLHEEMQPLNGRKESMFDIVSPIAEKMKLSGDTRSDFDVYMEARAKKVQEFEKVESIKANTTKKPAKNSAKVKAKKRSASPTGGNSTGVKSLDFAAMSDAELDAFLDKA